MSMVTRAPSAPGLTVVPPGEGRRGTLLPGVDVVFKIHGDHTGGALSIVEHPFEVGALVPPHVHHLEDEFSIVLEGEIGFRSEDQEVVLGPGGYIVKPHGEVHAMWNAGDTPARMIEVISPPGFDESFFQGVANLNEAGPPDPAQIAELAAQARLEMAEPDWLADVIARYDLTPPPTG
jgi:quercetin dioxygenase-like cupin family protein